MVAATDLRSGIDERAGESPAAAVVDPDRDVLARVAGGDTECFRELVERHQGRLVRLCQRLLGDPEAARDAAQEVFLKAFRKAGTFRPRGQVSTWLHRIAVNHCLNRLRRRRIVRFLRLAGGTADEAVPEPADGGADPEAQAAARQRWRRVRAAVAALPPGQRAVLVLVRYEGLPQRQAAEVLGITVGAVESRLVRALRNLERALGAKEAGAPGVPEGRRPG